MLHADVKLDTLGYFCPMPIIMTLKKLKELTLGQVLEVVSDDEGIKKDMPAWCDTTGHQMVGLEEEQTKSGTIYKAFVKDKVTVQTGTVRREAGGMIIRPPASLFSFL